MVSVHFQGKPSNITVIGVYFPSTDVEDVEVDQFYEDLPKTLSRTDNCKRYPFHHRGLKCKSRKSEVKR